MTGEIIVEESRLEILIKMRGLAKELAEQRAKEVAPGTIINPAGARYREILIMLEREILSLIEIEKLLAKSSSSS